MARRLGVTPHQLVLAWALAQAPNVIPIPSARTIEHVQASAAAADLVVSPADLAEITTAEFSRA
jgi:aryl-alcohol dehydrogenase-like predicted oxidoreductase